ncbi:aspartic proteinase CDR1-like protein [Tanacetum coccineum]
MKTLALVLVFVLINISSSLSKPNQINSGFSLDLIDRDSPQSPFYDPTYAQLDRLKNAFLWSTLRAFRLSKRAGFTSKDASIDVDISAASGEYLMMISIGTPPVKVFGIADTGSDLTWAQCKPCKNCYKQVGPLLVPSNSSTYRSLSCQSKGCKALDKDQFSCDSKNICHYKMSYVDRSTFTIKDLAVDTFWFGPTPVINVVFGCGHDNEGTFKKDASGIVGLGGGPLSIINQLQSVINGKFSYCLIPYSNNQKTSRIHFGTHANVVGANVVSTPLIKKDPSTFYYLTLESISVGEHKASAKGSLYKIPAEKGNNIIDSGTTLTYIPDEFYSDFIANITNVIGLGFDMPQWGFDFATRT